MKGVVGVLPAAGLASRLRPLRYPKELLPVLFALDGSSAHPRPILAAEYSLSAMRNAGIYKCIIIINENKTEIFKYFGDGSDLGMKLAYVVQSRPSGLPHAIMSAREWVGGDHVCLALPDTVFSPKGAVGEILGVIRSSEADLVLGVFPTSEPENLGPVRFAEDGRVLQVQDKPAQTDLRNTWGIAIWSPRFTALLHDQTQKWGIEGHEGKEQTLGKVFDAAVRGGLGVRCVHFAGGRYLDVGKPEGIGAIVLEGSEWMR